MKSVPKVLWLLLLSIGTLATSCATGEPVSNSESVEPDALTQPAKTAEDQQDPLDFDLGAIDTSDIDQAFIIHGRIDVTLRTDDDHEALGTESTALRGEVRFSDSVQLLSEIEFNSFENVVETDLLIIRWTPLPTKVSLDVGILTVPFGVERRAYAPSTSQLIQRPHAFTDILPGSFVDFGLMANLAHTFHSGGTLRLEAALTRGLASDFGPNHAMGSGGGTGPQTTARLSYETGTGLEVGASAAHVEWRQTGNLEHVFFGLDAQLELENWVITAEGIWNRVETPLAGGDAVDRWGFYLQGAHDVSSSFDQEDDHVWGILRLEAGEMSPFADDGPDLLRLSTGLRWDLSPGHILKTEYSLSLFDHEPTEHGLFFQYVYHW